MTPEDPDEFYITDLMLSQVLIAPLERSFIPPPDPLTTSNDDLYLDLEEIWISPIQDKQDYTNNEHIQIMGTEKFDNLG